MIKKLIYLIAILFLIVPNALAFMGPTVAGGGMPPAVAGEPEPESSGSVFYSVSPFGTGTIETGDGTITITDGVAVLSVPQTGNIGAGVCIEYNSIECWIAPNRIGFISGGTAELLPNTKIEDATSGAIGIVRAIELMGGTWAGGDAAGWIYFESTTGTFGNGNNINRVKPTTSSNIATIKGTIKGNLGNGNTEFVVKTATGTTAADQSETAVTSIHHEFASLTLFETGFIDGDHIDDTDLTNASVIAFATCYYAHDDYVSDGLVVVDGFTDGANNYLHIYTPTGGAESINNQRHSGAWDANKYKLDLTASGYYYAVRIKEIYTRVEGLQIALSGETTYDAFGFLVETGNGNVIIEKNIISASLSAGGSQSAAYCNYSTKIYNNIIYGFEDHGIRVYGYNDGAVYSYYNTIFGCGAGILQEHTNTCTSINSAIFNNTDDISGTVTLTYSAGDDADFDSGTGNVPWDDSATDWDANFTEYDGTPPDLTIIGTGADIYQTGTSLAASDIWRDIRGVERHATTPCIGAFEYE